MCVCVSCHHLTVYLSLYAYIINLIYKNEKEIFYYYMKYFCHVNIEKKYLTQKWIKSWLNIQVISYSLYNHLHFQLYTLFTNVGQRIFYHNPLFDEYLLLMVPHQLSLVAALCL